MYTLPGAKNAGHHCDWVAEPRLKAGFTDLEARFYGGDGVQIYDLLPEDRRMVIRRARQDLTTMLHERIQIPDQRLLRCWAKKTVHCYEYRQHNQGSTSSNR
jgi:hypothetical protein